VYESVTPKWDEGEIDLGALCNGDLERPLRLSVWFHRKFRKDVLVGICETTLQSILRGKPLEGGEYDVQNLECSNKLSSSRTSSSSVHHSFHLTRSMHKRKIVGTIHIISAGLLDSVTKESLGNIFEDEHSDNPSTNLQQYETHIETHDQYRDPYAADITNISQLTSGKATFKDIIKQGFCKFDLCVAIDFTSSNGDPRQPDSLHHQSSDDLNEYEETILSVGNAMARYIENYSVWGFGAKFDGVTRHLFQCGSNSMMGPEDGIGGVLHSYRSVFESDLIMSGPTVYDEVLQATAARAHKYQTQQLQNGSTFSMRYCVLLIITDGLAQDLEETKRKLEVYSSVPLSVIIVGLGRADFSGLYKLCELIGNATGRPNISFVEFRKHQHDPTSLGRTALQDLPSQVTIYMEQHGISPPQMRKF
jgi:hypothetical protein